MELIINDLCKTYKNGYVKALNNFSAELTPGVRTAWTKRSGKKYADVHNYR